MKAARAAAHQARTCPAVRVRARPGDDEGLGLLAQFGVVGPDHGGVVDVGVLDQAVLDLDRVDVLAAAQDHVAAAALQVEQAAG